MAFSWLSLSERIMKKKQKSIRAMTRSGWRVRLKLRFGKKTIQHDPPESLSASLSPAGRAAPREAQLSQSPGKISWKGLPNLLSNRPADIPSSSRKPIIRVSSRKCRPHGFQLRAPELLPACQVAADVSGLLMRSTPRLSASAETPGLLKAFATAPAGSVETHPDLPRDMAPASSNEGCDGILFLDGRSSRPRSGCSLAS